MALSALRRLHKRRHRDRTDAEGIRTPKRRRSEVKPPSSPTKPHPEDDGHCEATPEPEEETPTPATPGTFGRVAPSVLDTPASARTLSPWASSSPEAGGGGSAFGSLSRRGAPSASTSSFGSFSTGFSVGSSAPRLPSSSSFLNTSSKLSMLSAMTLPIGRDASTRSQRRALRSPDARRRVIIRQPDLEGVDEEEAEAVGGSEVGSVRSKRSRLGSFPSLKALKAKVSKRKLVTANKENEPEQTAIEEEAQSEDVTAAAKMNGAKPAESGKSKNALDVLEEILAEEEEENRRRSKHGFVVPRGLSGDEMSTYKASTLNDGTIESARGTGTISHVDELGVRRKATGPGCYAEDSVSGVDDSFSNPDQSLLSSLSSRASVSSAENPAERIRHLLTMANVAPTTITHVLSLVAPLVKNAARLQASNLALATQYGRLEASVAELGGENEDLRDQNRRLMLERKVAEGRARELEFQVDEMQGKLEAKGERITKLRTAVRKVVRMERAG